MKHDFIVKRNNFQSGKNYFDIDRKVEINSIMQIDFKQINTHVISVIDRTIS